MAEVVVTKAQLEGNHACDAYLTSPEWNGEQLTYADWDATVARLRSSRKGMRYLQWLVDHKVVPLTRDEFDVLRAAERQEYLERIGSL